MSSIQIRTVTSESALTAHTLIEEYYTALQIYQRDTRESTEKYWTRADCATWLVYVDDQPAGVVIMRPLPDMDGALEVKRLFVRPAYRGMKLADRLMDEAEAWASERRAKEIYLDSHHGLVAAVKLYRRRGYEDVERYNDNTQATVFLKKTL